MKLSAKQQKAFKSFFDKDNFFTLFSGAIRSGKSYPAVIAFIVYTQSKGSKFKNIIAGRNLRIMEVELLQTVEDFITSLGGTYKYNSSKGIVIANGIEYLVVAGHNQESRKRVQSMTAGSALIDEIQLTPQDFVNQIIGRLTFDFSRLIGTCNPEGKKHWLKTDYIDNGKADNYHQFVLEDNPTLSKVVIDRYKSLFTGVFYDRNILGLWVQSEGVIYTQYTIKKVVIDPRQVLFSDIGIDYGIKGITAYEKLTYLKNGNVILSDTYRYDGKNGIKTDAQLVDDLIVFMGNQKYNVAFIDPSASSFIAEARSRNLKIRILEADNTVLAGLKSVMNGFISEKLIIADTKANEPVGDELSVYAWQEGEQDKPIKENDHHLDALRYAYYGRHKNYLKKAIVLPRGL